MGGVLNCIIGFIFERLKLVFRIVGGNIGKVYFKFIVWNCKVGLRGIIIDYYGLVDFCRVVNIIWG